jgi:hypothetical protein
MINIDNLIQSDTIHDPWPHKVIKDFLSPELFSAAKRIADKIVSFDEFHVKEILWMSDIIEVFGMHEEVELIVNAADQLMDYVVEVSKPFEYRLSSKHGYFNNPRFGISMAESRGEIHDEGTNKIMALIIYIEPEHSVGTLLYKDNNLDTFVSEVPWEQNSAFLMFSQPNKTWHKFDSDNQKRITLNFYFEKIEALEHLNKFSTVEQISWLHEQFGKNKLIRVNKK